MRRARPSALISLIRYHSLLGVIRDTTQEFFGIEGDFLDVFSHECGGLLCPPSLSSGHNLESVDQPLEILAVGGQQDGGPGMARTDCVEIIVDLSSPDSFFMS